MGGELRVGIADEGADAAQLEALTGHPRQELGTTSS